MLAKIRLWAGLVVAFVLVLSACGARPHAPAGLAADVEQLRAAGAVGVLARVDTPGGAQTATSGVADLGSGAPVPADAGIRIASTTKTFVATVLLQLVEQGRLGLDDPVHRWLPGVLAGSAYDGGRITLRQLLSHTSGIADYDDELLIPTYLTAEGYRANYWRTYRAEEFVARAAALPPSFPPGAGWAYSNTNYVLAGMIIPAVTGRSWEQEVRERIVEPLGLRRTYLPDQTRLVPPPDTRHYLQFSAGGPMADVTTPALAIETGADGSIISTAGDINAFFGALLGGRLLGPDLLAAMRTTVPTGEQPIEAYGLGLERHITSCGATAWGHGGTGLGYQVANGSSDDGTRRVVVSVSSTTADPAAALAQYEHMAELVDRALCR